MLYSTAAHTLLDILFPPSSRMRRVRALSPEQVTLSPQTHAGCGSVITTLASYRDSAVKDAIQTLKYEHSEDAARLLARLLTEYLTETLAEEILFTPPAQILLVPVPLAPGRLHSRGYNQVCLVLEQLSSSMLPAVVRTDILKRIRETPHQTHLPRAQRLTNVSGCFSLAHPALSGSLKGHHIILIDDVTTTGATLAEAQTTLAKTGAHITPLAFAHA